MTKSLFTNFTRSNCFLQVWKNLFIVLKIRSHAKLTCIFVNCDENKKIFACCFPLTSSLVVYCLQRSLNVLYLRDSTQCYKQRTTLVQPKFVVRSLRILNSLLRTWLRTVLLNDFEVCRQYLHKIWRLKLPKWTKQLLNTDIMAFSGVSGSMEEDFFTKTPILKNCSPEQKSSCRTCAEACHSLLISLK